MQFSRCLRGLSQSSASGRSTPNPFAVSYHPRYFSAALVPPAPFNLAPDDTPSETAFVVASSSKPPSHGVETPDVLSTKPLPSNFFHSTFQPPPPPPEFPKGPLSERYGFFVQSLSHTSYDPSIIYSEYLSLQLSSGHKLPLEIQKRVLRRCALPPALTTAQFSHEHVRFRHHRPSRNPHPYEARLRGVLEGMKLAGFEPDIEDYHYVMEQFAAVGHYRASTSLLSEMGTTPNSTSFDLCFQALAFHANINLESSYLEPRKVDLTRILSELLDSVQELGMGLSPSALDAMIRVYTLSGDMESIERILRLGYGVDLANPDRHPPEFVERMQTLADRAAKLGQPAPVAPSIPTSLLNTIIVALGESGQISRMVTAFAVLTSPLPLPSTSAPTTNAYGFDEMEDDDPIFHDHLQPLQSTLPPTSLNPASAPRPNSHTFLKLIHYAVMHDSRAIALHYMRAAMTCDREVDAELRASLEHGEGPCHRPAVAVSSAMFWEIHSMAFARRRSHIPMRNFKFAIWLRDQVDNAITWKTQDHAYYTRLRNDDLAARGMAPHRISVEMPREVSAPTGSASPVRNPFNKHLHVALLSKELIRMRRQRDYIDGWIQSHTERRRSRTGPRTLSKEDIERREEQRRLREAQGLRALQRSFTWDWSKLS